MILSEDGTRWSELDHAQRMPLACLSSVVRYGGSKVPTHKVFKNKEANLERAAVRSPNNTVQSVRVQEVSDSILFSDPLLPLR
jgi:hypothetical protein